MDLLNVGPTNDEMLNSGFSNDAIESIYVVTT